MSEFSGQVALVTGSTGSVGKPLTEALLARGAAVVAAYHTQADEAEGFRQRFEHVEPVAADLRKPESGKQLVEAAISRWGKLDIVITAHSAINNAPIAELTLEQWHAVMQLMLTSTMRLCRAAIRPMQRARYGRIVTVTGYQPLAGALEQANYAAALGGVLGFGKALAREVAPWEITVNSVAPGLIMRPQLFAFDPAYLPWATNIIPFKRLGTPDEVVPAILMLAAPSASYINGQTITVDGGWRMV